VIPDRFLEALAANQGKALLVLCHDDADSDALGAAWVLADMLGGEMAVPRKVSEHARELQLKLKMQVIYSPDPGDYDLTIVVDTADAQQLPGCMPATYLLVDHHANNSLVKGALAAVYEQTDSTCQLVWRICRALGKQLQGSHALALGAGIMGDTRNLAAAANGTIADLAAILDEGGVSYRQLLEIFRITGRIDREVRLEAALSAQLHKLGNCLVVSAGVRKNYVYYIAMMLLELGADIAVVGYQQGDDCFIRLAKNPGTVHCLDSFAIMEGAVAGYSKTNLWGDSDYAGFNGKGPIEEIIEAIIAGLQSAQAQKGDCQCSRMLEN
jgi:nanoRNase/pAp phosphatase (c-di-AMP/oligoRNAs hydrolase)